MNRIEELKYTLAMSSPAFRKLMDTVMPAMLAGNPEQAEALLKKDEPRVFAMSVNLASEYELDAADLPADSVGVICLQGVIYGYDIAWLSRRLQEAASNDRLCGVVLWINSPGGVVTGTDAVADVLAGFPKPVATYVAGSCDSAAYWLACCTGRRFLGSKLSEVGSIGVVMEYWDYSKYYEKMGIDFRMIYPDTADLKNAEYRSLAEGGDDRPLKEKLAKIHALFCQVVAQHIGVPYDAENPVYRGATFMGQEAIDAGLADAFGTLQDAAAWVLAQSVQRRFKTL